MQGIQLADDQGNLLPLTVDQTLYFWNEKIYASTTWKPTVKITGIEYAELDTAVNPNAYNKYATMSASQASAVSDIPVSGNWTDGWCSIR